MISPVTQANRSISIETTLPIDTLLIESFSGSEGISRPFHYNIKLLADRAFGKHLLVKPAELIGAKMTLVLHIENGLDRHINGICCRFGEGVTESGERFARFNAELVSWFDLLKLSSDCRFFQDKTVVEIVSQVFADAGFDDFDLELDRTYTRWDYCCQYRESDFNFVSRMLEAEGIRYYFKHSADKHTLMLSDSKGSYDDLPLQPIVHLRSHGAVEESESILTFEKRVELQTSMWTKRDYHFEMPRNTLEVAVPALRKANQNLTTFDFPGDYAQKFNRTSERLDEVRPEGESIAKLNMMSEEANYNVAGGSSNVRALASGYRMTVIHHRDGTKEGKYVLTAVRHSAAQSPTYVSEEQTAGAYENTFTCIPDDVLFVPPRVTPKPVVQGPHTALVVDETDPHTEEIWPDKYGRVRVRFPWDRKQKFSCWLRVAQPWAGRGWGHQWVPRVGDEVLVDFVEGDPDCPIVVGSLYNADNMPPFKLPDFKTQSGIATRSSTDGTSKMFNMLRFEDKKGGEQVFIRSQKRGDIRILGSHYETVHGNRNMIIGFPDGTEAGGALNITVGGSNDNHVEGPRFTNIDGTETLVVKGDVMHDFQANYTCLVGTKLQLNAPDIVIEASNKIGLTVGGNCITIDKSGVTIVGMQVKINSGGAGPFVMAPDILDALDAAESDNGEPGYLDRVRRGGGGGGGRRRRSANVHHAISKPVTRRADGRLQVGDHIIIDGDQDFEEKALRDLSRMDTTTIGRDRIDRIDGSNHDVTIEELPPGSSIFDTATTFDNNSDAAAAGRPAIGDPPGTASGTGRGSGSTIAYDPDTEPPTAADPTVNLPSDGVLAHEMNHAVHGVEGRDDDTPDPAHPGQAIAETNAIDEENLYRDERGIPRRTDHGSL